VFEIEKVLEIQSYEQGNKYVSWLPCAHVFGQLLDNHAWIREAIHMHVVDNPLHAIDYCKEVQPHLFIGVPRIYEKVYSNLKATLDAKAIVRIGLKIPILKNIFKKAVKKKIGMSNCIYAITGAAPINPDILKLFHSLGIPLFEGYGMTEMSGIISIQTEGAVKIGSVGRATPGTELKILDDGEICVRQEQNINSYYKNEQATEELLKPDSKGGYWLHTGDVGYVDEDGYLFITDRKKDIIITAGGKNVAPQNIENLMKTSPYISQAMVYGDRKPYLTMLVTLDEDEITKFARDRKILYKDLSDLSKKEEVIELMNAIMKEKNKELASYESIKKTRILEEDLDQDKDELTPTLKVKRKVVTEHYNELLEGMYS
jgi:long-chain acyl-CoA synthetase